MKLLALALLVASVTSKIDKCSRIPKKWRPKYTRPRSIQAGNDQPAAVSFLIDERTTLMKLFLRGFQDPDAIRQNVGDHLTVLSTFASATDEPIIGQLFRQARQSIVDEVMNGQEKASEKSKEFGGIYRDNSQRATKALRDLIYNKNLFDIVMEDGDWLSALKEHVAKDTSDGAKVYQNFVETYASQYDDCVNDAKPFMRKLRTGLIEALKKTLRDERLKTNYRQLVNELPLVYQFFNDNIEHVTTANMDETLDEAIALKIMTTIASQANDKNIVSMLERNAKFIKKLMTQRAIKEQKAAAVRKIAAKNAELKAAADNEEEFNNLVEAAKKEGRKLTKELKTKLWAEAVKSVKAEADKEKANQKKPKDNTKVSKQLSTYQKLAGIVALLPDELLQTVADMVKQTCPELNLLKIETNEMKKVVEAQPEKFLKQLLGELHDVCEMFGLIDESVMTTMQVDGVDIVIYEDNYLEESQKKKKKW